MADPSSCVFCAILAGEAPATIVRSWPNAIAIRPHSPVTEGHTLVIPATHVRDVAEDPEVSALTMAAAAEYAAGVGPCNVITSAGREATQTVFHLHVHVVPRRAEDGLSLPWTPAGPRRERAEKAERCAATAESTISRVRHLADVYELNAGTVDGVAARNFFELFAAELRDALNPPPALLAEEETGRHVES